MDIVYLFIEYKVYWNVNYLNNWMLIFESNHEQTIWTSIKHSTQANTKGVHQNTEVYRPNLEHTAGPSTHRATLNSPIKGVHPNTEVYRPNLEHTAGLSTPRATLNSPIEGVHPNTEVYRPNFDHRAGSSTPRHATLNRPSY